MNFINKIINFNYLDFFSNPKDYITLDTILYFVALYFLVLWAAIVIWVIKDILNRSNNILFQLFCILLVIAGTPLGIFIYLLIRPNKTLYEKFYEEYIYDEKKDYDSYINNNKEYNSYINKYEENLERQSEKIKKEKKDNIVIKKIKINDDSKYSL